MVKLETQSVPSELETLYPKSVVNRTIRTVANAGRKIFQNSRKILEQLEEKSLFPEVAAAWQALDGGVKTSWDEIAFSRSGEAKGYNLFLLDYIFRISAGLSVPDIPRELHQLFCMYFNAKSDERHLMERDPPVETIFGKISYEFRYKMQVDAAPQSKLTFYMLFGDIPDPPENYEIDFVTSTPSWVKIASNFTPSNPVNYLSRYGFQILEGKGEFLIDNFRIWDDAGWEFRANFDPSPLQFGLPYFLRMPENWSYGYDYKNGFYQDCNYWELLPFQ